MKLVIIGAGGHFRSVIDSLATEDYRSIALIDNNPNLFGSKVSNFQVIGDLNELTDLRNKGFMYGFVAIGDNQVREQYINILKSHGYNIINIIDLSANISTSATLGEGIFVGKNTVINSCCKIGDGCILNTGSIVEHDSILGDFSFVSPGVILTGGVQIGNSAFIGSGTVVNPYLRIGKNTIIGSNSTVTKTIGDYLVAWGSPCEVKKDVRK